MGARVDPTASAVLGVFVGGRGRRLGGVDKSLLLAPDGKVSLLERALSLSASLGLTPVVVGRSASPPPSGADGAGRMVSGGALGAAPRLTDDPPGIGPLGGLCALLRWAGVRPVLALACDMPYVDAPLLERLLEAPGAPVVAPRDPQTGKWYPLCARYEPSVVLPVARARVASGTRSFQHLFEHVRVRELSLDDEERSRLRDWDLPTDVR